MGRHQGSCEIPSGPLNLSYISMTSGEEHHLKSLQRKVQEVYELKASIIEGDGADNREGTCLGRTTRWKEWGLELEGNEKHVQKLLTCTGIGGRRSASP